MPSCEGIWNNSPSAPWMSQCIWSLLEVTVRFLSVLCDNGSPLAVTHNEAKRRIIKRGRTAIRKGLIYIVGKEIQENQEDSFQSLSIVKRRTQSDAPAYIYI